MRGIVVTLCLLAAIVSAAAQTERRLGTVTVTAERPMKDIGLTRISVDSAALKGDVAVSLADVLTFHTPVFVKSYGRSTLSTVSLRGASPSHTQVTWNGMSISSPTLGMADFSMIPAFLVDRASVLYGSSSLTETAGGLGGLVSLSTAPADDAGLTVRYTQSAGSFSTHDEALCATYAADCWQVTTRAINSQSANDFKYVNHDKVVNIYDDNHQIVGRYHPTERNRSGAWHDIHLLQEARLDAGRGNHFLVSAWLALSRRHLPVLTTDHGGDAGFFNRQRDNTLRAVATWNHIARQWSLTARGGYINSAQAYDYRREVVDDQWMTMTEARTRVNTFFLNCSADWMPAARWTVSVAASGYQHTVVSHDRSVLGEDGDRTTVGYDRMRAELSASLTARWQPADGVGVSAIVREESFGGDMSPVIPALLADWRIIRRGNVTLRASASRNYRFPSLNDLYTMPGGNPSLRPERGVTYDAGISASHATTRFPALSASVTWHDSRIDDWILWLPTPKGFFTPSNVRRVHAYGIEAVAAATANVGRGVTASASATMAWSPSVNCGEPLTEADRSVWRQLPYAPLISANLNVSLSWRHWTLGYQWCHYSRRHTMTSSDITLTGSLPPYYMSNASLERRIDLRAVGLSCKLTVNNLLDEDYVTVLSRPMPGINWHLHLTATFRAP